MYEDYWASIPVPSGWTAAPSTELVTGDQRYYSVDGVKLSRGNYVLSLLTERNQASGIKGGRFGEIADVVAPWVDRTDPWACSGDYVQSATATVDSRIMRVDLYLDPAKLSKDDLVSCGNPKPRAGTLWYGTYFTNSCNGIDPRGQDCGGYFMDYNAVSGNTSAQLLNNCDVAGHQHGTQEDINHQMVVGLTMNVSKPAKLPHFDDPDLKQVLQDASNIIASMRWQLN